MFWGKNSKMKKSQCTLDHKMKQDWRQPWDRMGSHTIHPREDRRGMGEGGRHSKSQITGGQELQFQGGP